MFIGQCQRSHMILHTHLSRLHLNRLDGGSVGLHIDTQTRLARDRGRCQPIEVAPVHRSVPDSHLNSDNSEIKSRSLCDQKDIKTLQWCITIKWSGSLEETCPCKKHCHSVHLKRFGILADWNYSRLRRFAEKWYICRLCIGASHVRWQTWLKQYSIVAIHSHTVRLWH